MIKKLFIFSSLIALSAVYAQKTHTVVKGDNPYNISKKYGMTMDELVILNPKVKGGNLALGEVLIISKSGKTEKAASTEKTVSSPAPVSGKLGKIVLQPKQTIYGITKQYQISETELRRLNPELDSHMKIGDEVVLPSESIKKFGGTQAVASTPVEVKTEVVKKSETPVKAEVSVEKEKIAPVSNEDSYEIQAKDNYYKLTRKFNLSQADLFALNPGLEGKGLQPGEFIKIKGGNKAVVAVVSSEPKTTEVSAPVSTNTYSDISSSDDYVTYTVANGDTVFGILNKFGITLDDLLTLNPNLSQGLKSGMVLKIKKLGAAYIKKSGDMLNVVIMLPFGFDTNDSKYRAMSLDFLSGAKLAIERNAARGQKLDINVIDAGNEASFKNSLVQINAKNTDLIIGPFFKSSVLQVLDYVKDTKIPVVAPFANSDELLKYDNLILVETNDAVYSDRIVKEVKDVYSDQKIYIVADADKSKATYLKTRLEKELKNSAVVMVNSSQDIQLDKNMMTGKSAPVIAILVDDSDSAGDAFANKMIALSKEVENLKAFSMSYSPVFEKKVDELSQANLVYLMDRKINTDGDFEKEILADFKKKYCKTPSKYAVIGFDVVNDMLSRENKKGEIFKQMNKVQTQLATKFEFEKTKSGAYVNKGYRVVRLVPN
ncbi:LysM peptidoglycan-binding domain-containing protein [Kaistella sp. G5-32]|uniref:LysM peptidoglycan-binding domain-containing protein n=1 Tax=Kaistella gelatinilytica TaxID=2787636 RepID=A0ABS0FDC2_9FLAO|nr:LysM peptidoglycan-binding domain-containing protein [Kaistella gelatinilytica]MBF8457709.1 LysM peptidoglycan-binding domain-containing protein [Kaistella gelatinilytica]